MGRLLVVAWLCLAAGLARAAAPPLEAFGKLPAIEDAQISPDGTRFALIVTNGDDRFVNVLSAADHTLIHALKAGDSKLRSLAWAGPDHLIVTLSKDVHASGLDGGKREWFLAVDINTKTWAEQGLLDRIGTADRGANLNAILDTPMVRLVEGKVHVFVEGLHFAGEQGTDSLYDYDPDSGLARIVQYGPEFTEKWLVDAKGATVGMTLFNAKGRRWVLGVQAGGEWKPAKVYEADIWHPEVLGLGRDGSSILLDIGVDEKAPTPYDQVVELPYGAKDWGKPIVAEDIDDVVDDPTTGALIGYHALVGDESKYVFFDPKDQARWAAVLKAYAGSRVDLVSMSADRRKMIVLADSPEEGAAYALVDIDAKKAAWIGSTYNVPPSAISPKTPISFKAADGVALSGYLTLSNGLSPKALPLVVFPHGGPAARDEPGFDWWAQAMASRGYAVLQVNYRGSAGFGWKFQEAGFGQFGRKMQSDLSDGVRFLAAQGTIDPKRVCIVGASYGGYAALAGATLDSGLYRCAVSVAGMSDLKRDINWSGSDERWGVSGKRYWLRFMGVEKVSDPKLDEISPIRHVDQANIPILLIHGKDDTVVDVAQSKVMFDALKHAGKTAELIVLPHENHHLLTGASRLRMLEATMDFLARYNPA